jgi:acyl carrier protein
MAISELVAATFKSELGDIPLTSDLELLESGIIDSLALTKLVAALEDAYPGLKIADSDVTPENLGSVDRIEAYLAQRLDA